VVVLAVLEGFPHADVADALGISVGTVKSRRSRAKVRLRAELAELEA
jgi:DNA-directed RNA polymerase specialized sigma24 family protein